jgi:L-ascorbate metabolism protein UlaG (beta-lactamase superfamily)
MLLMLLAAPAARSDLSVIMLANEGVLLDDGKTRIMIDGFVVEPYSIYGGLPPAAAAQFDRLEGDFGDIDAALASHRHHDHNQPEYACAFLLASTATRFYSGSQVIGLMREKCRSFITSSPRIHEIAPTHDRPELLQIGTAQIRVFPLSHGTRKYARIQNHGHLVEMGGVTVLHLGDAAMDPADFIRAGLDGVTIDLALVPFWYFQPGPGQALLHSRIKARSMIAVHIPPGEMSEIRTYLQQEYPQVMVLEQPLDRAQLSSTGLTRR